MRNSFSIGSLNSEPEDRDRDRAEHDVPAEARVERAALRGIAQAADPRARDLPQVGAEVEQHRRHRPQLHDGREGGAGILPAEQRRDDPQVPGRGDRQELGEALDDPLDDGLQGVHAAPKASDRRGRRQPPARASRTASRLWRRPTSAVAAARATIAPVPTTTVAVRARVIAV